MNKEEFIKFLEDKECECKSCTHWKSISKDKTRWELFKFGVDWLEDDLEILDNNKIKITYNKSLYDNNSAEVFITDFNDFVLNYNKTL